MSHNPKYLIGIDLGTTHCAMAFTHLEQKITNIFSIPQWDVSGLVESELLPSVYYLPPKAEWRKGQFKLPWQESSEGYVLGRLAKEKAYQVPGRVIQSAKSWLSTPHANPSSPILPWHSDELTGDDKKSPVEVAKALLVHLRESWDFAQGQDAPFCEQKITITVPASFDEAAQHLTLKAAALAGYDLSKTSLLEEPQAAFEHWLSRAKNPGFLPNSTILVIDIGGGTTDFSLFKYTDDHTIVREKVGEHILLGGDNFDLLIAKKLEASIGSYLPRSAWYSLVDQSRSIKESLLNTDENKTYHASVNLGGSSLFAQTFTASIDGKDLKTSILEGFFPLLTGGKIEKNKIGIRSLGLNYAQDSRITAHLSEFLQGTKVDHVLFTGGSLISEVLQERLLHQITVWQDNHAPSNLTRLIPASATEKMSLSVALGAAIHRPGIKGGYPRSVYLEVFDKADQTNMLLCITPKGSEVGKALTLPNQVFEVKANHPIRFQAWTSLQREFDTLGFKLPISADAIHNMTMLPPLLTRIDLKKNEVISVTLEAKVESTGVLSVFLKAIDGLTWKLDFSTRESSEFNSLHSPIVDGLNWDQAKPLISQVFGKSNHSPKGLVKDIEAELKTARSSWHLKDLRTLWHLLWPEQSKRARSPEHEAMWYYLAGYSLRPGFGTSSDYWSMQDLSQILLRGMSFPKERSVQDQWWIMWRRVAGGLNRKEQDILLDRIMPTLRKQELVTQEIVMLAGSLEKIGMQEKIRLGNLLTDQIAQGRKSFLDQKIWALARIASRSPLYGGSETIVPASYVAAWGERLLDINHPKLVLFFSQAGRLTGDLDFDLPPQIRDKFAEILKKLGAGREDITPLFEVVPVKQETKELLFGEALPLGLTLT